VKRRPLTRLWIRWRRYRVWALLREGMNAGAAWSLATEEAHARRGLVRKVGRRAAEKAPLQVRFTDDGGALFAIVSSPDVQWGATI
jgi:hypothetical protein